MQEEQNKSFLYQYIWGDDGWLTTNGNRYFDEDLFKKIDQSVILDGLLTINDKAVYLSILKLTRFTKNYKTKIASNEIEKVCGVIRQSQTKSIKKLKNAGYIKVFSSRYENAFTISREPRNFLPVKLEQFENLKLNRKEYIRRLIGLFLSSGNERIPTYKTCLKKMGKLTIREYQKISQIYNEGEYSELDIDNYKKL